jgi:hypothetical protein
VKNLDLILVCTSSLEKKLLCVYLLENKTIVFLFAIAVITDVKINILDSNTIIQKSMDAFQMLDIATIIK